MVNDRVKGRHRGMRIAPAPTVLTTMIGDYQNKVREIALAQCRGQTTGDVVTEKAKDEHAPVEDQQAA